MSDAPEDPVTRLSGVGPALATRLEKLGVRTLQDLALLLPTRYEDRTRMIAIGALRPGQRAVIEGEVLLTEVVRRRRPMLVVALDYFPRNRGTAAAVQSFLQTAGNALVAGLGVPLLGGTALIMAFGQLGFVLAGLAIWWGWRRFAPIAAP